MCQPGIKPPAMSPAASKSQHTAEGSPEHCCGPVEDPTQHHRGFLSHHRDQNSARGWKFLFTYYVKIQTGQAHLKQLQMVIKSCVSEENEEIKFLSLFSSDSKKRRIKTGILSVFIQIGSKFKGPFSKLVEN